MYVVCLLFYAISVLDLYIFTSQWTDCLTYRQRLYFNGVWVNKLHNAVLAKNQRLVVATVLFYKSTMGSSKTFQYFRF